MRLDEYMESLGVGPAKFAKIVGASIMTINNITRQAHSPNLALAIRIVRQTKGDVQYEDLVFEKECSEIQEERKERKARNSKKSEKEIESKKDD